MAQLRLRAALALASVGRGTKEAVAPLIALLKDQDDQVRLWAIDALAGLGPEAREAVPALRAIAKQEKSPLYPLAAYALVRLGEAEVCMPILIRYVKGEDL